MGCFLPVRRCTGAGGLSPGEVVQHAGASRHGERSPPASRTPRPAPCTSGDLQRCHGLQCGFTTRHGDERGGPCQSAHQRQRTAADPRAARATCRCTARTSTACRADRHGQKTARPEAAKGRLMSANVLQAAAHPARRSAYRRTASSPAQASYRRHQPGQQRGRVCAFARAYPSSVS